MPGSRRASRNIVAEIVGFSDGRLVLMPESGVDGLAIGAPVIPLEENAVAVGEEMMGRVLDGAGQFIDGGGDVLSLKRTALEARRSTPSAARRLLNHSMWVCGRLTR